MSMCVMCCIAIAAGHAIMLNMYDHHNKSTNACPWKCTCTHRNPCARSRGRRSPSSWQPLKTTLQSNAPWMWQDAFATTNLEQTCLELHKVCCDMTIAQPWQPLNIHLHCAASWLLEVHLHRGTLLQLCQHHRHHDHHCCVRRPLPSSFFCPHPPTQSCRRGLLPVNVFVCVACCVFPSMSFQWMWFLPCCYTRWPPSLGKFTLLMGKNWTISQWTDCKIWSWNNTLLARTTPYWQDWNFQ